MNEITKTEMRKRLGNITQLQELLFGEQIEEYDHKLEQYNQRLDLLESESRKFQLVIEDSLRNLETRLLDKINLVVDAWEKKLQYYSINAQEEQSKTKQDIEAVSQQGYDNIDFIQNSLNVTTSNLRKEINQSKVSLDRDLQSFKQEIFEKLESNLAELSTGKVSRSDLADVLFDLCVKLKGQDIQGIKQNIDFELEEANANSTHVDLILPERSNAK